MRPFIDRAAVGNLMVALKGSTRFDTLATGEDHSMVVIDARTSTAKLAVLRNGTNRHAPRVWQAVGTL